MRLTGEGIAWQDYEANHSSQGGATNIANTRRGSSRWLVLPRRVRQRHHFSLSYTWQPGDNKASPQDVFFI
ncbi:hypothetical protein E2C01_043576 [Portunus trituberculatus]|uniref:Uncharacterized protein n=1 Tax=Portunus trituberculatus TaxID=210409 RepID=A0A5B7FXP7_PORTR|nr:hypothetical protein [Portunus trituberculatus]